MTTPTISSRSPRWTLIGAFLVLVLAGFAADTIGQERVISTSASRRRPVTRPEGPLPPEVVREIDAVAADALSRGVPGMAIGVRIGDGVPFLRGYGLFNIENGIPVHAHDVFQVGSITKQFVAALIMMQVQRGTIDLNDSIGDYVPELDTRGYTVTIHHLLTHTAGVPNYTNFLLDLETPMTHQQIIELVNEQAWDFPPGSNISYSNTGYYLAGMVLEKVTAKSFVSLLNEEIILPLGLMRTSYCGTIPGEPIPRGYVRFPGVPIQPSPSWSPDLGYAAGALCSTTNDLVRWAGALAGGRIVSQDSWRRMTTKVTLDSGAPQEYGYGLVITIDQGKQLIGHGGAVPGFLSFLAWYPEYDLAVAVLTNLYGLRDFSSRAAVEVGDIVADWIGPAKGAVQRRLPVPFPTGPFNPGNSIPRPER